MVATRADLIELLIAYAGDDYTSSQAALVESIVDDAIEEVRNKRYPHGYFTDEQLTEQETEILSRYVTVIRRIMEYHYDKIGKEGVTTFYEAGQTTSWESGGTPPSFLALVTPVATLI